MEIRKFTESDRETFLGMAKRFYATDSVDHAIPEQHMRDAFDAITAGSPYVDGFLILHEGAPAGYAVLVYTYSMEFGGKLAFLDELFILPEYQGHGLGGGFLSCLLKELSAGLKAIRLDFVTGKDGLRRLYEKRGFKPMGYSSMVLELG